MLIKIVIGAILLIFVIPYLIGIFLGVCIRVIDRWKRRKDWELVDYAGNRYTVKGKPFFKRG